MSNAMLDLAPIYARRRDPDALDSRVGAHGDITLLLGEVEMLRRLVRDANRNAQTAIDLAESSSNAVDAQLAEVGRLSEALRKTADALETVLSADPEMPSFDRDMEDAEAALQATQALLEGIDDGDRCTGGGDHG